MKRLKRNSILVVLCMVVLVMSSILMKQKVEAPISEEETMAQELTIESIAINYIQDFIEENYEQLNSDYQYDTAMQELVDTKQLQLTLVQTSQALGEVIEIEPAFVLSTNAQVISTPLKCTNMNINVNIIFNEAKEIAGLYFVEYMTQEVAEVELQVESEYVDSIKLNLSIDDDMELPGTLTMPKHQQDPVPCVILVHGSGPNDKDSTIYENTPFKDIAEGLGELGIAVYRYDKRTLVYPQQCAADVGFTLQEETIEDVASAFTMLQQVEGIDSEQIYILGHSLGGYSIPRIAAQTTEAAGYIILGGNVEGVDVLLEYQYEYLVQLDGTITEEEQAQLEAVTTELERLQRLDTLSSEDTILGIYKPYWVDLSEYNPIEVANDITQPVLVLQGERDYQVTMEQFQLWKDAFSTSSNWKFVSFPGLNHIMMMGEGLGNPVEYQTKGVVAEEVIQEIGKFVK